MRRIWYPRGYQKLHVAPILHANPCDKADKSDKTFACRPRSSLGYLIGALGDRLRGEGLLACRRSCLMTSAGPPLSLKS
jgi:hypothetical protein